MNLTLSPEVEARILRKVNTGEYASAEQVIEAALFELEHYYPAPDMTLSELQAAIDEGVESADNEPLVTPEEARAHLAKVRESLARA